MLGRHDFEAPQGNEEDLDPEGALRRFFAELAIKPARK